MIKKVGDEFKDFHLGKNIPADETKKQKAVIFGKTITVKDAKKAVGGNTIQNFFARLQLFVKNKGWLKDKNINARLSSHELKDLMRLESLFNKAYPDKSKVEDKRLLKFMDKFVSEKIASHVKEKFYEGIDPEVVSFVEKTIAGPDPEAASNLSKNIRKLYALGITGKDLLNKYAGGSERQILGNLSIEGKVDKVILREFGLTPEYFAKLEKFSPNAEVQLALFKFMPESERKNLESLIDAGGKAIDLVTTNKDTATPAKILAAVKEAIKT